MVPREPQDLQEPQDQRERIQPFRGQQALLVPLELSGQQVPRGLQVPRVQIARSLVLRDQRERPGLLDQRDRPGLLVQMEPPVPRAPRAQPARRVRRAPSAGL